MLILRRFSSEIKTGIASGPAEVGLSEDVLKAFQIGMENEIVSLKECGRLTGLMKTAVMNRDSAVLKSLLDQLSGEAGRLKRIEERRNESYFRLCRRRFPQTVSFYELMPHLPESERERTAALYRALRAEVIRYQGHLKNLDDYVYTVTGTVTAVLETFSSRNSGGGYNRSGRFPSDSQGGQSVFVSAEL